MTCRCRVQIRMRSPPDCSGGDALVKRAKGVIENGKKVPKARAPSAKNSMATCELRRIGKPVRKGTPRAQRFHPARVVARVGSVWHASAHKGNPLFRRRAPVSITADPKGLLQMPQRLHLKETLRGLRQCTVRSDRAERFGREMSRVIE